MAYAAKTHWIQCPNASVALKDLTNNLTYALPAVNFEYEVNRGNAVVKILDGSPAATNILNGTATGRWRMNMAVIPSVTTAAWFNNAYTLTEADNANGYYNLTVYRFPTDASPIVLNFSKFDTFSLRAAWDLNGANTMVRIATGGWSTDPLDGTALSLPSAGPLGSMLSFATSNFGGTATQVAEIGITVNRNCAPIPEVDNSGTNANLPLLCGGLKQGQLTGGVLLRQSSLAVTVPGNGNAEAALTVAFGAAAYGISFATNLLLVSTASNVDAGFTFQTNTYQLVSADGTIASAIQATDL